MAFGLAEFDPFAAARRDVLYDPADGLPAWTEPPDKPRLFVYLGPETPHFEVIVQALVGLNVPIEAHFRGEGGPVAHLLKLRGHVVHDAPPSLTDVLQRVSHVVTMGGLGVSQAALAAGRPQLVMPLHDETQHNYRVLNERGVVQRLWPEQDEHNLRKQIFAFLSSGHRMAAAKEASLQIGRRARNCGRVALMGAIRKHLA
jgi:UDP:flavonoid glycosyltransferase YjiC (YdhE family)